MSWDKYLKTVETLYAQLLNKKEKMIDQQTKALCSATNIVFADYITIIF